MNVWIGLPLPLRFFTDIGSGRRSFPHGDRLRLQPDAGFLGVTPDNVVHSTTERNAGLGEPLRRAGR